MPNIEDIDAFIKRRTDICRAGRGANETLVQRAEQILSLQFPQEYREFLIQWGTLSMAYVEIYGIAGQNLEMASVPNGIWFTLQRRKRPDFSRSLVVLCDNEGDQLYCLETDRPGESRVVTWDVHRRAVTGVRANTFFDFILNMAKEVEYVLTLPPPDSH